MNEDNNWEKEFDKQFVNENLWEENGGETKFVAIGNIKEFIAAQILAAERSQRKHDERLMRDLDEQIAQAESRGAAKGHLEAFELIHEHFMGSKNKDVMDALETIQAELIEKFPPAALLSLKEE